MNKCMECGKQCETFRVDHLDLCESCNQKLSNNIMKLIKFKNNSLINVNLIYSYQNQVYYEDSQICWTGDLLVIPRIGEEFKLLDIGSVFVYHVRHNINNEDVHSVDCFVSNKPPLCNTNSFIR